MINTGFPKEYAVDTSDYIEIQYQEMLSKFQIHMRIVYNNGTKDKYLTDYGSILRPRLEYLQSELERNGVRYKMVEHLG